MKKGWKPREEEQSSAGRQLTGSEFGRATLNCCSQTGREPRGKTEAATADRGGGVSLSKWAELRADPRRQIPEWEADRAAARSVRKQPDLSR